MATYAPTVGSAGCVVVVGSACDGSGRAALRVMGDCDRDAAAGLEADLSDAAGTLTGKVVVVDIADLRLFGSAAIEVIVRVRGRLRGGGRDLVVRHPGPIAQRILELVGPADLLGRPPLHGGVS